MCPAIILNLRAQNMKFWYVSIFELLRLRIERYFLILVNEFKFVM